jgi:hypothetical protein
MSRGPIYATVQIQNKNYKDVEMLTDEEKPKQGNESGRPMNNKNSFSVE